MHPARIASTLLFTAALALAAVLAHGQSATDIKVWVEPNPVRVGDPFTVFVQGPGTIQDVLAPGADRIQGDVVILSTRQQTQSNIIGNNVTTTFTKSFVMRANSPGDFSVGPFDVVANGQAVRAPAAQGVALEPERVELPDLGVVGTGRAVSHPHASALTKQLEGNAFAIVEAPETAAVGEVIHVKTYMYRSDELPSWADGPDIRDWGAGAAFLHIPEASQIVRRPVWESVQVGGRSWQRALISIAALSPTRAGKLPVSSSEFVVSFPLAGRSRDPFGGLMSMRNFVDVVFDGARAEVDVRPLPQAAGAAAQVVGNISAGVLVDRTELSEGDLVTLTLRLSGAGYLKPVALDSFPEIDGLDFLSQQVNFNLDSVGPPVISTKTFEYTYQASRAGDVAVPPITIAVVDPETGRQSLRETQEVSLRITPSEKTAISLSPDSGALPAARARARTLADDVLFDATPPAGRVTASQTVPAYRRVTFWTAQGSLLVLGLGVAGFVARKRRLAADPARTAARRAWTDSALALESAEQALRAGDQAALYHGLGQSVRYAVAAATGREASGLTNEETARALERLGLETALCGSAAALLDRADAVRYAPVSAQSAREDDLETARAVTRAIREATP